jgi:excisionase family DNA binding protein
MIWDMDHQNRLVTVADLADYLGVPPATLYQWRYRGEGPPGFRVGRHLRYRWSDVHQWIESRLDSRPSEPMSYVAGRVAQEGR